MTDQTNRARAIDRLDAAAEAPLSMSTERYSIKAAQVYALLDIADAIRETKTDHTIRVTQHLDAEAVARSIRTHLDGEDA